MALKLRKVRYEKKEHIAYVTIDNAKHENCLEAQVDQDLWAVWRDFHAERPSGLHREAEVRADAGGLRA